MEDIISYQCCTENHDECDLPRCMCTCHDEDDEDETYEQLNFARSAILEPKGTRP